MLLGFFAAVASLAWVGWFAFAPALGFPDSSPAAVLNGVVTGDADASAWVGWIIVAAGLAVAATAYFAGVRRGLLPSGIAAALLYGLVLWFVLGAIVMPLLGTLSGPTFSAAMGSVPTMPAMRPTFMMLGQGPLAPIAGLIGWLLFAAILAVALPAAAALSPSRLRVVKPSGRPGLLLALGGIAIALLATGSVVGARGRSFELWVIDQAGTGRLHVYSSDSILGDREGAPEVIDLAKAAAGVGDGPGEKPHMLRFNPQQTHALIANRDSGHVYVMRVSDRRIVASIDAGEEVHDVTSSPDGRIALISKMADKRVGVMRTDYETETFTYDPGDDLDVGELEGRGFPDNQPVCSLFPRSDRVAYVTVKGGGLYVVDARDAGLRIVEEFPSDTVAASGCGAVARDGKLYLGWGTESMSRFYVFDYSDHRLVRSVPVNKHGDDGHGIAFVGDGRYIWMAMRGENSILIIDSVSHRVVGSLGDFGPLPDMPVVAPSGDFVFVTLRGPAFYEGSSPRLASQTTPGFAVFQVFDEGRSGAPAAFFPMAPGSIELPPDPHAVAIRTGV